MKKLKSLIVLFRAHASLELSIKQSLVGTGLSVNEFSIMEALHTKKRVTTGELIDLVLIPNSSMTYVLDKLSEVGCIVRERDDEDRRTQYISLTEKGKKRIEEVYAIHYDKMIDIFSVLTNEEEFIMQEALKKLGKKSQEVYHDLQNK